MQKEKLQTKEKVISTGWSSNSICWIQNNYRRRRKHVA